MRIDEGGCPARAREQISAPGREPDARGGGPGPAPERVAQVRRRILEGAYDSAEVAGRVAEGILRSGDL
ncbi:MAG TPA: hypothetical protein VF615_15305 [Longimicrobiaceae bacterium]|jgi:hypothetical protein